MIGIGTRWSDFTTASKTAFRDPDVRFVNVNIADFDAAKHAGVALVGDARATLERLTELLVGWSVDDAYREQAARLNEEWDEEVVAALRARPRPAARAERGARRGQRRLGADRRRRLRRGRDARRPAQALAHARPEGLPRRVRLLVHGLRDRRRARRQAGRAGAGGLRPRRRRLLPDALERARHRGPGRAEADDRARRQPRLQLDRLALALARHRRLRHALPLPAERLARSRQRRLGRLPAGRPRRQRRVARRARDSRRLDRGAARRARGGEGRVAHDRDRDRGRPLRGRAGLRELVGRRRSPRSPRVESVREARERYEAARE